MAKLKFNVLDDRFLDEKKRIKKLVAKANKELKKDKRAEKPK